MKPGAARSRWPIPQFGTTATHFHALRQHWGDARWEAWCRALAANKPFLVDGNSVVVKMVGRGEAWIGLTDSDDIAAGQAEGLPIAALPMTRGDAVDSKHRRRGARRAASGSRAAAV